MKGLSDADLQALTAIVPDLGDKVNEVARHLVDLSEKYSDMADHFSGLADILVDAANRLNEQAEAAGV